MWRLTYINVQKKKRQRRRSKTYIFTRWDLWVVLFKKTHNVTDFMQTAKHTRSFWSFHLQCSCSKKCYFEVLYFLEWKDVVLHVPHHAKQLFRSEKKKVVHRRSNAIVLVLCLFFILMFFSHIRFDLSVFLAEMSVLLLFFSSRVWKMCHLVCALLRFFQMDYIFPRNLLIYMRAAKQLKTNLWCAAAVKLIKKPNGASSSSCKESSL